MRREPDNASAKMAWDIQQFVKERLAAHEYPREIEYTDRLLMTAPGKIMRREPKIREPK